MGAAQSIQPFDWHRIFLGDQSGLPFLLEICFRTAVMYGYALVFARFVGKRGGGQISPFEFILIVIISSAAGDPMFYPDFPLVHGLLVLTVVMVLHQGAAGTRSRDASGGPRLADRSARHGASLKFDELADDLFKFFRGTALLFYRDMAGQDAHMPSVMALGDVHPKNFGVMPDRHGSPIFGVNDFDEAIYAPFTWDLKRGAVGFWIAARKAKRGKRRKILAGCVEGYLDAMQGYADRATERNEAWRMDNSPKVIRRLFSEAWEERRDWLRDDYLNPSGRGFRANDELQPISGEVEPDSATQGRNEAQEPGEAGTGDDGATHGHTGAQDGDEPKIRAGTKQAQLIAMLKAFNGATIAEIAAATGWQAHTARGAITGVLKKRLGLTIESDKVEGCGRVYCITD